MGKTKTAFISGEPEAKRAKSETKKKEFKKAPKKEEEKSVKAPGLKGGERIRAVEAGPIIDTEVKEISQEETKEEGKKKTGPRERGKKWKSAKGKVDPKKLYKVSEAVKLAKETSFTKFDGSIELHMIVKNKDLNVNVKLPHSTGKSKTIEIASDETVEKLKEGKVDFDVLLATADMMPKLVPFARILGPKGLMPNPKNGTLIKSREEAKKFSSDATTIKTEKKQALTHTVVGKVSLKEKDIEENIEAILDAVNRRNILKASLNSTMGPGIRLEI